MRRSSIIATVTACLLTAAVGAPVLADGAPNEAWGRVTWSAQQGVIPGLESRFAVRDGQPGADNDVGDGGHYRPTRAGEKPGSLRLDIRCVKVEADWAEFAGIAYDATGVYFDDEVWLVSVFDSGRQGTRGDEIGMKSMATDGAIDTEADLVKGCGRALDDKQFGRKGLIDGGNIKIRHRD